MNTKFCSLIFALAVPIAARAQTSNPFPNSIPLGGLAAEARPFATIPNSAGQKPRLNQLLCDPNGRIFVTDQRGPIYVVSADGATVTPYLDLSAQAGVNLLNSSEQGFQAMAFHPDFLKVGAAGYGKFYTTHTTSNTAPAPDFTAGGGDDVGDNVVLEWTTATPGASTFVPANPAAPFRELLRFDAPYSNHTIGSPAFNPTSAAGSADYGKLYISAGDGGSGGDPLSLSQNHAKPYGKILRIDPLGTNSTNGKYGIPSDNPFVGVSGTIPEIWALGFRNPQRYSWDLPTGRMFIGDIGQGVVEEIDLGVAGANYGWHQREGSFVYVNTGSVGANSRTDGGMTGFTYPIAEYDHSEGVSITGGFVYRGSEVPGLAGKYLFGDIAFGRVFMIDGVNPPDGGQDPITELRLRFSGVERSLLEQIKVSQPTATRVDLRLGADSNGRIFLLNKQDGIVRLLADPSPLAPAPSVRVIGKFPQTVHSPYFKLRGNASGSGGVKKIQVKVRSGAFKSAHGTIHWRLTIQLHPGRNRVQIRAVDENGTPSPVRKVIVIFRPAP